MNERARAIGEELAESEAYVQGVNEALARWDVFVVTVARTEEYSDAPLGTSDVRNAISNLLDDLGMYDGAAVTVEKQS